jgi:hypothetical protein
VVASQKRRYAAGQNGHDERLAAVFATDRGEHNERPVSLKQPET